MTKYTSQNGRFICDTTTIKTDGVPVRLNPIHYGKQVEDKQVGFITDQPEFLLDTKEDQIQLDTADLHELFFFIEKILFEESKK